MASNASYTFGNIFWSHGLDTHLLLATDLYMLRSVCATAARQLPLMLVCRRWLLRFEAGRGMAIGEVRILFREFTAARAMRFFLRRVQQTTPNAVIAGSFPAWIFLSSLRMDTWRPRTIDIFLFDDLALNNVAFISLRGALPAASASLNEIPNSL